MSFRRLLQSCKLLHFLNFSELLKSASQYIFRIIKYWDNEYGRDASENELYKALITPSLLVGSGYLTGYRFEVMQ